MLGYGEKNVVKLKDYFKVWGNDVMEFYCHPDFEGVIPEPKPAVKYLPDWFKGLAPTYDPGRRDMFGDETMTAKKCLPMLDAMSLGFTIPLGGDLHVTTNYNNSQIEIKNPPGIVVAEFHDAGQVGGKKGLGFPHGNPVKFINRWVIKTKPGWSTFFIPPLNHFDQPFRCLGGFVDTDAYPKEVNFPAAWITPDFDDSITAGTPLVTAIPIKRNAFNNRKPKVRSMTKAEMKTIAKIQKTQDTRKHHYTYELRKRKEKNDD